MTSTSVAFRWALHVRQHRWQDQNLARPRKIRRNGRWNGQKRPGELVLARGIDEPLATSNLPPVCAGKQASASEWQ
jgi:hypothetical protein